MQVIYIDTLFVLNFVVNYLILLTTAKIAAQQVSRLRIGLGALAGGVYAVLAVFPQWGFLTAAAMKLVSGVALALIVFGGKRDLLRTAVIFFAVSAAFGGAVYAVSLFTGTDVASGGVYLPVSLRVLVVSFALCYGALSLVFARMGRSTGELVPVTVRHRGAVAAFSALVDTGNSLTDPVTGGGVLVAETACLEALFSEGTRQLLTGPEAGDPVALMEKLEGMPDGIGFYLIPYTAVGVGGAFLLAFRPESVQIGGKERKGVSIALSPTRVSDGGRYTALVNGGAL